MKSKNYTARFYLLEWLFYSLFSVSAFFFVPLLQKFGFSDLRIGITLTISSTVSFAIQLLSGYICDKTNHPREIVAVSGFISILAMISCLFVKNNALLYILPALINAPVASTQFVVDSWMSKLSAEGYVINYGISRSGGSLAAAIGAGVYGLVIVRYGFVVSPFVMFALLLMFYAFGLSLPQPSFAHGAKEISAKGALSHLLRNKAYLVVVVAYFFVFLSTNTLSFYAVLVSAVGGTTAHYGLGLFIAGLCETFVMFFFAKFNKKFGSIGVLFLGIAGSIFRCAVYSLAFNVTTAILFTVSQMFSYALFFPAMNTYIREIVDRKYLSTAFLAVTALSTGIGAILGSTLWGAIAQVYGVQVMYRVSAIPSFISIAILLLFRKVLKKGPGIQSPAQ